MRIVELIGENVKRIKAIRLRPKGNLIVVSGKNGAGKTSVLDLIWYCLDGGKGLKDTPIPIRKGETKAKAVTVLAEPTEEEELAIENGEEVILKPLFTVTRTWTEKGSYLKVTNAQGEKEESPQELLDSFIGRLTFDPLNFAQMKEKDQRELLLKLAGIDLEVLDNEIADIREKRRGQGQAVKLLTGERKEVVEMDLPDEEISLTELNDRLSEAYANNNEKKEAENKVYSLNMEIQEYETRLKEAKDEVTLWENKTEMMEKIDIDEINNSISEVQKVNEQIRARDRLRSDRKREKEAREKYDGLTSKVNELEDIKKGILDDAKMPIKGLGISDTGVVFNGTPFSQLSSSEQLRISMGMAMAMNPTLRALRITDGSLLDDENMKVIRQMAKDRDFQVFLEKVDGSGKIGVYIEDGEVKAINGKETN